LLLDKIITTNTLGAHNIQGLTIKTASNRWENPSVAQPKGMSFLGKKNPDCFSHFFVFQKAENRASTRIKLCDILDP
jgi:hypothetical protein